MFHCEKKNVVGTIHCLLYHNVISQLFWLLLNKISNEKCDWIFKKEHEDKCSNIYYTVVAV